MGFNGKQGQDTSVPLTYIIDAFYEHPTLKNRFLDCAIAPLEMTIHGRLNSYAGLEFIVESLEKEVRRICGSYDEDNTIPWLAGGRGYPGPVPG